MYREIVQESVISTMEGYHASVFAYGQTATGKTYTMAGSGGVKNTSRMMNRRRRGMNMNGTSNAYDDHEDDYTIDEDDLDHEEDDPTKGIIQLSIEDVFDYIYNQKSETREYLLRVSFMEIYNEVINDLLATSPTAPTSSAANHSSTRSMGNMNTPPPAPSAIRIFESKHEGVIIRGLKEEIVTCPEQVYALLAAGEKRRQTGSTLLNKQSSRSHSIFRLIVESRRRNVVHSNHNSSHNTNMSDTSSLAESIASSTFAPESTAGPVRVSTLSLVDLAGSESVKNTGSKGMRQKEGQYINKSLLTLGHVIYKLAEVSSKGGANGGRAIDATHIPYRDSKLTRLLQPSLSGNAQICIICNISPLTRHLEESHLTLKFASRAKRIKQHATITEVVDEKTMLENYREEIEELKRQLKEAKESYREMNNGDEIGDGDHGGIANGQQVSDRGTQEDGHEPGNRTNGTTMMPFANDEDAFVLSQAISNLERLILKTSTAEERKRRKRRKELIAARKQAEGGDGIFDIPPNLGKDMDSMNDTLLNMLDDGSCEDLLLSGSLTDLKDKAPREKVKRSKNKDDDNSLGSLNESLNESLSLDDGSTIMEGQKLVSELHRIKGLLGNVLERKSTPNTPDGAGGYSAMMKSPDGTTPIKRTNLIPPISPSNNKQEVERLKAQLHEQAVSTSLRAADTTFLQSELEKKERLLQDVSQVVDAAGYRIITLETENETMKREYAKSIAALKSKESEVLILEKLIKKREKELKKLRLEAATAKSPSDNHIIP
jgi:centromeric protein E